MPRHDIADDGLGETGIADVAVYKTLVEHGGPTEFTGYVQTEAEGHVRGLLVGGAPMQSASEGDDVELTGGEPLLQKNSLPLMQQLCDDGFTVLIETSGAHDIAKIDPRVHRIMDLKCPSSGESERNLASNIAHLKPTDEVKFVIGTWEDYEWAKAQITAHHLTSLCPLLFSWVHPLTPEQQNKVLKKVPAGLTPISRKDLAEQIIADALPVRFQIQQHKIIWPPEQRGV